jgi:ATP-dependent protease ClpP protease subunit
MAKIKINGVIVPNDYQDVYDWFGMDATSPRKVSNDMGQVILGERLDVEINSGGGEMFAGSEIYSLLKNYAGNVNVQIVGLAASAASVIAMAGDSIFMAPTAQLMIHNVQSRAAGDYRDMEQSAELLKNLNTSIANAYQLKTGMDQQALLDLMDQETWMNAQQAKDKGFVDGIMFDSGGVLTASTRELLPVTVINKTHKMFADRKNRKKAIYECRLNLLTLKGEQL